MRILILGFIVSMHIGAFGQVKQKMADNFYSQEAYAQCVEMYDELANKYVKNKTNIENVRRAAISHYHLFQFEPAIHYLDILKKENKLEESDRLYYIESLRYLSRYTEANDLLIESLHFFPSNKHFLRLESERNYYNALIADSSLFTVKDAGMNSALGDFAPTFFENKIIYATKSKNTETIHSRYAWDNGYYVSLLESEILADSTLSEGKLLSKKLFSRAHDGPVSFTNGDSLMVITKNMYTKSSKGQQVKLGLFFSNLIDGKWSEPQPFEYNHNGYNVGHGVFSEDGKSLYFVSDMPGGQGGTDIYLSMWDNGKWTQPTNLGAKINTDRNELFPFVEGDKLYFASNGHFGLGGLDIFEVTLNRIAKPTNLGYPVNTSFDDFGIISKSDGEYGYFSSNRNDAIDRVYAFTRRELDIEVIVNVFEKYEVNELVLNQPIELINELTGEKETYYSDMEGNLKLRVRPNEKYKFSTSKPEFKLAKETFLNTEGISRDTVIKRELILLPTKITIALKIIAKDTRKPLELAKTTITDYVLGTDTTMMTNEYGLVTMTVDRNKTFWAHGSKKGYIDTEKAFNTSDEDGKIIQLELEMPPIKKGEKFKLENIFYDLNKSTLRPESQAALDKLAEFIIKNELVIELSSHTDARGSNTYNQKLSQARAQSCVDYLYTKGVQKNQIRAKGYGETQLVNRCKDGVTCTEEEHQENRRTEVKILDY